jgi:hypothetical protein
VPLIFLNSDALFDEIIFIDAILALVAAMQYSGIEVNIPLIPLRYIKASL